MTAYGVRIRDASGAVRFDPTAGAVRMLGSSAVAANTSGSVVNALFQTATPFFAFYPKTASIGFINQPFPQAAFDGNQTLYWGAAGTPCYFVYGVFAQTSQVANPASGYGLRARNTNGITQIDSAYPNLFYASKWTVVADSDTVATYNITARTPLFAFRGSGALAVQALVNNGGDSWKVTFCGNGANGTVYLFDSVAYGTKMDNSAYGLRVRDGNGAVVFDSRMRAASVVSAGLITLPVNTAGTVSATQATPQAGLAAILSTGWAYQLVGGGSGQGGGSGGGGAPNTWAGGTDWAARPIGTGCDDSTLTASSCRIVGAFAASGATGGAVPPPATNYWLVDVTGL